MGSIPIFVSINDKLAKMDKATDLRSVIYNETICVLPLGTFYASRTVWLFQDEMSNLKTLIYSDQISLIRSFTYFLGYCKAISEIMAYGARCREFNSRLPPHVRPDRMIAF